MKTEDVKQDQQQELIPLVVGEFLQHHRLKKNLTLATVAEAIKLDEKLLSDIEHDEAGHIALVYRKGYIEAYAKFLQIPLDEIPTLSDPDSEKQPAVRNIFAIPPSRNPMDKWLRATSYVLASLLIGTLAWQFTHEAVRLSQGGSQLPRTISEPGGSQRANEPVNASIAPLRALHGSKADGMDTAEQAWTAITQPVLSDGQSRLQINVSADSWIEITDADGVELEMDLLRGGSEKSYKGKPPFRILFGRASAIHLSMDDVPVDLTAHTIDDVAQLIWPQESTAENLAADELQVIDQ
jgi:cytoskeleton protein RodZ